jgi:hypothetical protein
MHKDYHINIYIFTILINETSCTLYYSYWYHINTPHIEGVYA